MPSMVGLSRDIGTATPSTGWSKPPSNVSSFKRLCHVIPSIDLLEYIPKIRWTTVVSEATCLLELNGQTRSQRQLRARDTFDRLVEILPNFQHPQRRWQSDAIDSVFEESPKHEHVKRSRPVDLLDELIKRVVYTRGSARAAIVSIRFLRSNERSCSESGDVRPSTRWVKVFPNVS